MKKLYRKILIVIGLLAAGFFVAKTFFPGLLDEILAAARNPSKTGKLTNNLSGVLKEADKVLGQKVSNFSQQLSSSEGPIDIKAIVERIADTETVKEVEQKIEEVVQEKTERIQKIPQDAVSEVKDAARKEVRKKVCEEWLEE